MYYILNDTNQIIAADENLLNLCGVAHINELTAKITQGETPLEILEDSTSFSISKTILSSTLGDLTLVGIKGDLQEVSFTDTSITDDDELFSLIEDVKIDELEATEEKVNQNIIIDDEPLDLGLDDPVIAVADVIEESPIDFEDISIDVETLSQNIGISSADYNSFLNEFIDNAIDLESDLQNPDTTTRRSATRTLSTLADVLHLPQVGDILTSISTSKNPENALKSFYEVLSRITTTNTATETIVEPEEETLELFEAPTPKIEMPGRKKKPSNAKSFGTISLEGVKAKHFDFQLEEAANDLSLPVELIEEFVHDFIEQAHIETKKMLEAYEEGDLDAIQKIGHLLKGASSNLRINALSDTLYKIQFTETSNNLDLLIKDYWAHFLSFEHQIDVISNQKEK